MSEAETPNHLRPFATFSSCPEADDIDEEVDEEDDDAYEHPYELSRHWCLLAEIIHVETLIRPRLEVRDRSGEVFVVAFYPDSGREVLPVEQLKVGRTVAILYPHQHQFLDGSRGIRQEFASSIQIIPLPLADIMNTIEVDRGIKPDRCQVCDETGETLSKCGRCGLRWVCGKDCQKIDWVDRNHKAKCKGLKLVRPLLTQDWLTYHHGLKFPL